MNILDLLIAGKLNGSQSSGRTEVTGSAPTISPTANVVYQCGVLSSLSIADPPASGTYTVVFSSGSPATTTSFPAGILGLENFAAAVNTIYEINVMDNRAVYKGWRMEAAE